VSDIIELSRSLFGAVGAFAVLVDHDTGELVLDAVSGAGEWCSLGSRFRPGTSVTARVASTGRPVLVDDLEWVGRFAEEPMAPAGYVPSSIMAAPLLRGGVCLGVIVVLDRDSRPGENLRDLGLLVLLADRAALSLSERLHV
jgi:GAF domain-containing protein